MKILLADDHAIFREGFAHVVRAILAGCSVIEAGSFLQALQKAGETAVDLMVVDLRMPGMDGFQGITALKSRLPATPLVVLTASEDRDDMLKALEHGAVAFIPKTSGRDTVAEALRVVLGGGVWLPRSDLPIERNASSPPAKGLTPRQLEVATLVRDGLPNKQIAWRLGMSEGTVKAHLSAVMRVLGVRNRVLLVRRMEELGHLK